VHTFVLDDQGVQVCRKEPTGLLYKKTMSFFLVIFHIFI